MIGNENFCCETSLLADAIDTLRYIHKSKDFDYSSIAILCRENLAEALIKHTCVLSALNEIDLDINYIDFDKDDYCGEYGLIFTLYENELSFSIEKAMYNDGNYKYFDFDYLYISNECDADLIVKHVKGNKEGDIFSIGYASNENDHTLSLDKGEPHIDAPDTVTQLYELLTVLRKCGFITE